MKKIIFAALAACTFIVADAQLKTPAPSPTQTVKQDFGLSSVELSYSRPAVKGRKIFGDIVPFGNVWRTGSKQTDVTSPAAYKPEMDLVRVTADVAKTKASTESFTIQFANVKPASCELHILWDKSAVVLPIGTEIDGKIMASIEAAMKTEKPPYFQAAMYYMENGKDLNQALSWFNKAVETQPNAFWIQHQWANCLAKLGQKSEAKTAALKSKELASAAKNDDYVKLNDKLLKELAKN